MPPLSGLEQACVVKGGLGCISGPCEGGVNYSIHAADFILKKMLENQRYNKVICVNLDRSMLNFTHFLQTYPKLSCINSFECDITVQDDYVAAAKERLLNTLRRLDETLKELINLKSIGVGVVVYSVSEVAVCMGEKWTLDWVKRLGTLMHNNPSPPNNGTNVSQSASHEDRACVLVMQCRLHSPQFLSLVQRHCTTFSNVLPNTSGVYANVLCTIHTVRKSPSTGRVTETTELFAPGIVGDSTSSSLTGKIYELQHVSQKSTAVEQARQDEEDPDRQGVKDAEDDSTKNLGALSEQSNRTKDEPEKEPTTADELLNTVKSMPAQLVLFDRNDEEFDEDSDSDGDLDL